MQKQLAIKIFTICLIAGILLIIVQMVKSTVNERQYYQEQASRSVAASWTGPQLLISPVLVIPYELFPETKYNIREQENQIVQHRGFKLIYPDKLIGQSKVANSSVFKGIYEIPIYNSEIKMAGTLSSKKIQNELRQLQESNNFKSMDKPYISIYISDMRGISNIPTLTINNINVDLELGSRLNNLESGLHADMSKLLDGKTDLRFEFASELKGMSELSFVQLADNASMAMSSNWPHPSFIGSALPDEREINPAGFSAKWSATRFSNKGSEALKECVNKAKCYIIADAASGVNFIEPVDVYLQSERSVKYAILFIGLSFITFFIFENLKRVRIHPIQYSFVGLAISIFYLLLIALAEHIAFIWAYMIAVTFCTSLLLFYLRYMLRSLSAALLFSAMLLGLYALLYVIIQAEDFAMLMGALLVFTILSILMFVTRKFDWYQLTTFDSQTSQADVLQTTKAG